MSKAETDLLDRVILGLIDAGMPAETDGALRKLYAEGKVLPKQFDNGELGLELTDAGHAAAREGRH